MNDKLGLCWRCEWRARYHETGIGPRWECQTPSHASYSCYMYRPVSPYIIKRAKHDRRPLTLNALSCRVNPVAVPDCDYKAERIKGKGFAVWCVPKEK